MNTIISESTYIVKWHMVTMKRQQTKTNADMLWKRKLLITTKTPIGNLHGNTNKRDCKSGYLMNSTFMSKGICTNNSFMRLYMKSTVLLYLKQLQNLHKLKLSGKKKTTKNKENKTRDTNTILLVMVICCELIPVYNPPKSSRRHLIAMTTWKGVRKY